MAPRRGDRPASGSLDSPVITLNEEDPVRRQLYAIAAVAVAATTLSACGAADMAFASTYEDDAAPKGKITAVRLDNGAGSVTLRGGAAKTSLHRELKYRGERPKGETHRVENGVLILDGCGSGCSASYTVDLPAGLPVSGGTSSGRVKLTRVGKVDVRTSSGSIHMDGVNGPINVRTSNGRIEGTGLRGDQIEARTSNGAIRLTPVTQQNIRARTSNGSITVTVPTGRYQVTTHTSNGDRKISVTNDPAAPHRLDLTTSNGDITAKPAG
ncbi:DUF4097 family beta strand repeat-containing protein [Actinomadura terrae]|uniref:DUF4097 family beta strand repeat-containing protein n=1 Tax=Actinomadura terrae TaxID=604353 RepID=UPI001FA7BF4C|nr:DUF4097 family beta strand repeat-containing protein [Actinomadura terrae]